LRIVLALLIPLAFWEAWAITPGGDYYKPMDFAMYYTAGKMFIRGMNPYDRIHAEDVWDQADPKSDFYDVMDFVFGPNTYDPSQPGAHWLPVNLIPPAFVVTAPFALLNVPAAWTAWNIVIGLLLAGQLFAITRLMNRPFWDAATLGLIIIELLMDPLHVGLANGQPAVPAIALTIISLWLMKIDKQKLAGIALAIATALKPQLAGPFVIYFLWQRKYKAVGTAAVTGLVLFLIAVVPLQIRGIHWLGNWMEEVNYAERPGGINDARVHNIGRQDMIHLQILLHIITDDARQINAMAAILVCCFAGILLSKATNQKDQLAPLAGFATLALLPVYHRMYDAGILMLVIAWAMTNLTTRHRWRATISLVFLSGFFVSQAEYEVIFQGWEAKVWILQSWWFNLFLEPHYSLQLLGIFFSILSAVWVDAASEKAPVDPALELHYDHNRGELSTA
jgi:hypothetical protein